MSQDSLTDLAPPTLPNPRPRFVVLPADDTSSTDFLGGMLPHPCATQGVYDEACRLSDSGKSGSYDPTSAGHSLLFPGDAVSFLRPPFSYSLNSTSMTEA